MAPLSSTSQPHGVKRKKPPTFQHLPAQRAKKLKQSWVEVQKIKSKWKAQKRKEGLGPSRPQLERAVEEDDETREETEENAMSGSSGSGTSEGAGSGDESGEDSGDETSEDEQPPPKSTTPTKTKGQQRSKTNNQKQKQEAQPSGRDLQRMAYSRSSLHTHKSNPLHRHKGVVDTSGRGGRGHRGGHMGRSGRGGDQNRGRGRGRGRGQPDMGLRMKAMLERIKQDHT